MAFRIRHSTAVMSVLLLVTSIGWAGCGKTPPTTATATTPGPTVTSAVTTTAASITTAVTTIPTTSALTTILTSTTSVTTTDASTAASTTHTPATTIAPTTTGFHLVEVRDYVMDNVATPPMAGPQHVTDQYVAFLDDLADAVLATAHSAEIGPQQATIIFVGPNGPGVTAWDPLTTTTSYSWTLPDQLVPGETVSLTGTGSQQIQTTAGVRTWTSGQLYFSLYASETPTFEMDYTGSGTGLVCIDPAFGNALPALGPGETTSHGTYPLAIPSGPNTIFAIEVMFTPFDGNRTLHRVYYYQP